MHVFVVGSGAREHAIVRSLVAGGDRVTVAPGNPGIAQIAQCLPIPVDDLDALVAAARHCGCQYAVIGPEVPLVLGLVNLLHDAGIPVFGPEVSQAKLEGSKAFAKQIMQEAGVPTAASSVCLGLSQVEAAMERFGVPHVIKDDGLAAGKGVVVTEDWNAALLHARDCFEAGHRVVVEEYLDGPEISLFCLCDGATVVPLHSAQDFKRAYDGDEGPNTGGMGAYSPLPWAPVDLTEEVVRTVAQPVVDRMAARGEPFCGVLYCGLALTSAGLRVVEFNVRFGDPETQVVLARLKTPLGTVLRSAAMGELDLLPPLEWSDDAAVTVVIAAENYPGTPVAGVPIAGIENAETVTGVHVLHAGTAERDGQLVSAGGRVLSVTATGSDIREARERAYAAAQKITLAGSFYRHDIAARMG